MLKWMIAFHFIVTPTAKEEELVISLHNQTIQQIYQSFIGPLYIIQTKCQ
jgi:hypothetical protein